MWLFLVELVVGVALAIIIGIFCNLQFVLVVTLLVFFYGCYSLWRTKDWELGSLIGVFEMAICVVVILVMWTVTATVHGINGQFPNLTYLFTWILR